MTDVEKIDLIEAYHKNSLNTAEREMVDNLAKEDADFAQELEDYLFLLDGFSALELDSFESQMASWEQQSKAANVPVVALPVANTTTTTSGTRTFSLRRIFSAAAAVAVLAVAIPVTYSYFNVTDHELAMEHWKTSIPLSSATRSLSSNADAKAIKGFNAYAQNQFQEAVSLLNECLNEQPNDPDILFFLAASKFQTGDAQGASRDFEQVIGMPKNAHKSEAEWLLALSQLDLGNRDACKRLLQTITSQPYHDYQEQAKQLLTKLQ